MMNQDTQESIFFFILSQFTNVWTEKSLKQMFAENNLENIFDEQEIEVLIQTGKLTSWIQEMQNDKFKITELGRRKGKLISKEELKTFAESAVKAWKVS